MTAASSIETTPVLPRKKRSRYVASPTDPERKPRADKDQQLLEGFLEEAAQLVDALLRGQRDPGSSKRVGMSVADMLERAHIASSSAVWGNHSPGSEPPASPPRQVLDADNNIIERAKDDDGATDTVSDRTGRSAIAKAPPEVQAVRTVANHIQDGLESFRKAMNTVMGAQLDKTTAGEGDPACKSCARQHHFEPVWDNVPSSGLCRWCYNFWLVHHEWPNAEILDLHIRGIRITPAKLRAAGYRAA